MWSWLRNDMWITHHEQTILFFPFTLYFCGGAWRSHVTARLWIGHQAKSGAWGGGGGQGVTIQPIHIGWADVGAWPGQYQQAAGKGAKESSLFSFWVSLCLSKRILLKRPFYSGGWVKKMGDQKWCVLKRSCHKKWTCSAWDFCKGGNPALQNTFSGQTFARRCKAGEDLLQRSHSNVLGHLHCSQEMLMSFSHLHNNSHPCESFLCLGSPLTFVKTIRPEDFYIITHETHQQHFWALLWIFGRVGNQERVKSGGSYMLYKACRSGLTLECNWSQALTLNLEIQS